MATKIQLRRDTEANWTSNNPILASGEIGISTDKSNFKIGDGTSNWKNIKYAILELGASDNKGIAIGETSVSDTNAVSIGHETTASDRSLSIGLNAVSEGDSISLGRGTESINNGISIGNNAKGSDESINIGASNVTVPENHIQIGTTNHEALKIPAIAGATDGLTLKINSDGTIYAE